MRERIPHDYLAVLGGMAVLAALLLPIYWRAGVMVMALWVVATLACMWKYQ